MPEASTPPKRLRPVTRTNAGLSRREFFERAAIASVGVPSLGALLQACSRSSRSSPTPHASLTLAAPDHPVSWPISARNEPIADGLTPERNATLKLYNYADYIAPAAIKSFEKKYAKYGVKVSVSTFNDADEALTKVRSASAPYDIYFPSYDQISKLVSGNLIRPLNHSYITNIANVWAAFANPWYDGKWRYTVPYTVYTTGIGWRTDRVKTNIANLPNPYDTLWDPKYRGQTGVIDDWHTTMAMTLLRKGITDVNTDKPADLNVISKQLSDLSKTTSPKVTVTMYNDLPAGQLGQTQMWSGDIVNAVSYLPKGTSPKVLRYWFPSDGKGLVDNDLMVVLRGGKNPVLSHLFLQHMLDTKVSLSNFSFIGYQPPQRAINPDSLVSQGYLPSNLAAAVVKEEYFSVGYRLLELSPANDAAWHKIWLAYKAGS